MPCSVGGFRHGCAAFPFASPTWRLNRPYGPRQCLTFRQHTRSYGGSGAPLRAVTHHSLLRRWVSARLRRVPIRKPGVAPQPTLRSAPMPDILATIAAYKREEIVAAKRARPLAALEDDAKAAAPPRGFVAAIERRLA